MSKEPDELLTALEEKARSPKYLSMAEQADALLADVLAETVVMQRHERDGDGTGVLVHGLKVQAMIDRLSHTDLAALAMRAVGALALALAEPETTETATA